MLHFSFCRTKSGRAANSRVLWFACCLTESLSFSAIQSSQIALGERWTINSRTRSKTVATICDPFTLSRVRHVPIIFTRLRFHLGCSTFINSAFISTRAALPSSEGCSNRAGVHHASQLPEWGCWCDSWFLPSLEAITWWYATVARDYQSPPSYTCALATL